MAKLRKFVAYRRLERPYTRTSKYREKSYIRARPNSHVVKYEMGATSKKFQYRIDLISKEELQIRHNALEAARQTSLRLLEKEVGKTDFHLKIKVFPHHVLRENPLASGAGADRMSTGMKCSFGKAIGIAARIKKGQAIFSVRLNKTNIDTGKLALKRASHKFPRGCSIQATKVE